MKQFMNKTVTAVLVGFVATIVFALGLALIAHAKNAKPKPPVLITNANIFAGQSEKLATGMSVLVAGRQVLAGIDTMFALAKKYKVKVVFGTDVVWNAADAKKQNQELVSRTKYFTTAEVLAQATSLAGKLLQLSGLRNPYPGKIGVIEEGALADILIVNGDPLKDISILTKPEENLAMIMKEGKIYKNTIK